MVNRPLLGKVQNNTQAKNRIISVAMQRTVNTIIEGKVFSIGPPRYYISSTVLY
jgi:hypothetical protein